MNIKKHVSLNLDVRGLDQSATLGINERCQQLQNMGRNIYKFGLGQSPFPVPLPVVDALKHHAHQKAYLPVKGLPALRNAVAEFHKKKDLVDVCGENVLIGPGSKELMFLLQLVFYGELLIPTPCWVSYVPQAQILGKKVRLIPTSFEDRWHITADVFAQACESERDAYRPRVLVLTYPGNPEGLTYSAEELRGIAKVAREYEVILLADEIYGQLHHRGEHVSVARYYPEGTIVSSGLSKWCGAGGWRLGTFAFPKELDWLMEAMAAVASETYTSVSAPIQYAAIRAFQGGIRIERYLWHARRILEGVGQRCTKLLQEEDVRVHPPEGAFYLFMDFSRKADKLAAMGIKDSPTLCSKLLEETGVAILPGIYFERPKEELTARMAYVNFDGAKALAASEARPLHETLSDGFFESFCGEALEATRKMVSWLEK